MTTQVRFELRRDTAANWSTNDPVLLQGEPGFDLTNNQLRIGNGVTGWNYLDQLDVKTNEAISIGRGDRATQGIGSISIGTSVGLQSQDDGCVAIGRYAGENQDVGAIAIGSNSGSTQGIDGVAIGTGAGFVQKDGSVAIGSSAGTNQGIQSVALGQNAAMFSSSNQSISIGYRAGYIGQQDSAVAIGFQAGSENQGISSIAIGSNAGYTGQANYTTIINATSEELNGVPGQTGRFYVAPIRSDDTQTLGLAYNTSTKEIVTSNAVTGGGQGQTGPTGYTGYTGPTGITGPTGPGNGVDMLNPYASFVTYNSGSNQAIFPDNGANSPYFPALGGSPIIRYWTQTPPAAINTYPSLYCGGNIVGITGLSAPPSITTYPGAGFMPTLTGLYQISANFVCGSGQPETISFGHWEPVTDGGGMVGFDRISGTVTNSNNNATVVSANITFVDILTAGQAYAFLGGGIIATGGTLTIYDNSQVIFTLLSTKVTAID
jgi:hypothetical protein